MEFPQFMQVMSSVQQKIYIISKTVLSVGAKF